ncbi:MAG: methyltransferase domain-containing protein [Dehalococcoidales bacterium]|nr:methyltransferase domain-containing protein [Dehalococcoidales bacterium]
MVEPKKIVTEGYDGIALEYLELVKSIGSTIRTKYLEMLIVLLSPGATILELGCGAGIPMTRRLIDEGFKVTGVDISPEQLALAEKNVPEANLILGDMTTLEFDDNSCDAVTAFYSITHIPRAEHPDMINSIFKILKPGGILVANLGKDDLPDSVEDDWLGKPMFFSHYDADTSEEIIRKTGFEIVSADDEPEMEYDHPICFRWFVARKPDTNQQNAGGNQN